jgi:hypothetical protein
MSLEEPAIDSSTQSSPANLFRTRPASERKIQANRRNALRSTGPKTERGKRTVARNAIKHGILAREVVITAGDGKESSEEFDALVGQLWKDYEPVGVVEESLVQTIANCWWRKARVLRAENGEIRKRLDTQAMDRAQRNSDKGNSDLELSEILLLPGAENQGQPVLLGAENPGQPVLTKDGTSDVREALRDLRKNPPGLAHMTALLQKAKSEVARDGHISLFIRNRIFQAFRGWDYTFASLFLASGPPKTKKEDRPSDRPSEKVADEQAVDEHKKNHALVAAAIDELLEKIGALKGYLTEREDLARDAEARSFSLPPADATDKLLRYEAHLDRQLYRAMDELDRLQRRRQGENVPPPLNINLGRRR